MFRMTLLLLTSLWLTPVQATDDLSDGEHGQRLSLNFDDAPVERILQALADYQQVNLLIAPGVEGRLSLRLDDVPWRQAGLPRQLAPAKRAAGAGGQRAAGAAGAAHRHAALRQRDRGLPQLSGRAPGADDAARQRNPRRAR